jgi:hypothetical protein
MYHAGYDSIADWNPNYKADVAEEIAVNSLRQGLQERPERWSNTSYNFKKARGSQLYIYDPYVDRMKEDDESQWRPDGLFYSKSWDSDLDASEHIVLQEVKTGSTIPDLRDSQLSRMRQYAKLPRATVYYSFVEFTEDGFNLSLLQLRPDGGDDTEWFVVDAPPGADQTIEVKR